MNITTGGPHILLFERDQQLVALLTSELQLAGYECHAARTAVEVFDAIARYPVRLVLVDLAQAAATRREFWVALDTQRRGRGVQVVTFHCTNIAGYGPSTEDVEDRSQTMLADIEVDGMLGIMNMVNAIRSRIAVSNSSAMSRLSANANASSTSSIGAQVTAPLPSITANNSSQIGMATVPASSSQPPVPTATITASPPPPAEVPRTATPNFTDKIRAVIYPNQRSWRSPGTSTSRDTNVEDGQPVAPGEQLAPTYPSSDPFATGQAKPVMDEVTLPKESGLAQLSRMLQENQPLEEITLQQQVRQADVTPISPMPLRASPIQDLPTGRPARGQSDVSSPNLRRPNEAAHLHYTHHPSSPTLMSINTPTSAPQALSTSVQEEERPYNAEAAYSAQPEYPPEYPLEEKNFADAPGEKSENDDDDSDRALPEPAEAMEASVATAPEPVQNIQKAADNAVLLDIVQSLPPMSSPPPQIQVHNGRATRSLGSVLLEGHLVAQNRLEVAQRIQRMLRGVDMNYQLGEILLMFKLLTPDQLLAASLVSYGLITAAQISALGRIRQELYSIGLEYDLENLLILFRILTSEQLREVRASW